MSKGLLKDSQFTASSSYDEHHQPYHARLNKTVKGSRGGWCSAFADETEFLEVNLGNKTAITGKEQPFSISLLLNKFSNIFEFFLDSNFFFVSWHGQLWRFQVEQRDDDVIRQLPLSNRVR